MTHDVNAQGLVVAANPIGAAALTQRLVHATRDLGEASLALQERFGLAADDLSGDGGPEQLATALGELELVLELLTRIELVLGPGEVDLAPFTHGVTTALARLEVSMSDASPRPAVVAAIRSAMLPALAQWPVVEPRLARAISSRADRSTA